MPSTKEKLKKIIDQHKNLFVLLDDLDKTGKLRKTRYKKRVNFTLDEELFRQFRNHCQKNQLEMSPIVEELVRAYLKKKGKN